MIDRLDLLRQGISIGDAGIEIGPWFNPAVPRRAGYKTLICDVFPLERLKQNALADASIENALIENIEEVDIVGSVHVLEQAALEKGISGTLDFVVSSHNIEHFPDPIRFLQACSVILRQGGIVNLALPDRRNCFDLLRPNSDTGDMLQAYWEKREKPTAGQIFSSTSLNVSNSVNGESRSGWGVNDSVSEAKLTTNLDEAYRLAELNAFDPDAPYQDAHCWCFTPDSFRAILFDLQQLGILDLQVLDISTPGGHEFFVHLRNEKAQQDHLHPDAIISERTSLWQAARHSERCGGGLQMRLTREDVAAGYRFILGREPESEDVLDNHVTNHQDIASFRQTLLASEEFQSRGVINGLAQGYSSLPRRIDTEVSAALMSQLVERVRRQWSRLGEDEPYWGVLTDERFKSDKINEDALAEFRSSGQETASLIDSAILRGIPSAVGGTCVELGCGVGRITRHLASRFEKVIAIDISPGNLTLCKQYMENEGIRNVETVLLKNLDDLTLIEPFDWFFSVIVLQHNSPPIQRKILEALLPRIRAGGAFVFQTVSDLPGYEFIAEQYLATEDPVMEIHALPQKTIFNLLEDAKLDLNAARMDPWVGAYGSYTYEGYKV